MLTQDAPIGFLRAAYRVLVGGDPCGLTRMEVLQALDRVVWTPWSSGHDTGMPRHPSGAALVASMNLV